MLLFQNIENFSLTYSTIYGAYEAAVWFGPFISEFTFSNNIITGCNFFWLREESTTPKYKFRNSLIVNNDNFMGFYSDTGFIVANRNGHLEENVRKKGRVILTKVRLKGIFKGYLILANESDGRELKAGILKKYKYWTTITYEIK